MCSFCLSPMVLSPTLNVFSDHTESPKAQDNNFNRDLGEIKKTEVFRTKVGQ